MIDARCFRAVIALLLAIAASTATGIEVDPGDYTALPGGANVLLGYYQHAERTSLYSQGDKVPIDPKLTTDIGVCRAVHFMDIGGYIVDPQILLPFGTVKASRDIGGLGSDSGLADAILAATLWLVNDPANQRYFGITPFIYPPIGHYEKNKPISIGENRWKYALQAGYITPIVDKVVLDLYADVTWYGKNTDCAAACGAANSQTLKQAAYGQVQSFLRYQFNPGTSAYVGLSYAAGGETKINDIEQNNRGGTTAMRVGVTHFLNKTTQVIATYGRDLNVRNGLKEENRVNLRLLWLIL